MGLSLIATRMVDISLCSGGCDVGRYLTMIRMLNRSPRGPTIWNLGDFIMTVVGGVQGGFQTRTQQV